MPNINVGRRNVYSPCFRCAVSSLCVGAIEGSVDQLAFDLMLPVATLKEYVEMVRRCLCGCGCVCVGSGCGGCLWVVVCVGVGMWMCGYVDVWV